MSTYLQRERRRRQVFWSALVLLTGAAAVVSYYLVGPPPPNRIRLATGQPGGAYAEFGQQYAELLKANGLQVDLQESSGSIENVRLLSQERADVAFVQSGTYDAHDDPLHVVCGIASVCLEPLWVFYRGNELVSDVSQFRGRRLAIGVPGSGTERIARLVLGINGIDDSNTTLLGLTITDATAQLEAGKIDAAFLVSSFRSPKIHELLDRKDLQLMGFRRYEAYVRIFPYLTPVELSEGVLDLEDNVPPERAALLAPSVLLVCREDTHPRVVEQLIAAARSIHSAGSRVTRPGQFPALQGLDIPIHATAEAYVRSGESLMTRLVPYWAMHWIVRAQFLILPLLTLWIPFFKILPLLYRYRIGSLLKRHYAALRDVESGIENADSGSDLREAIEALESLRNDMQRLSRKIPAFYQQDVYHWRAHVAMVQHEVQRRLGLRGDERPPVAGGAPPPPGA